MQIIKIKCYILEESDGGGMHNITRGYAANETTAKQWVNVSKGWRSYRPFEQSFIIAESFDEFEKIKLEEVKERALKKLNAEERKALGLE